MFIRILKDTMIVLLLRNHQEVLFLALLNEQVFAVEQVGGGERGVRVGEFLLVDADAAALGEFAHFALRGEDGGVVCGEDDGRCAFAFEEAARHFVVGHAIEYVEERLFVEAQEGFLRRFAEEDLRGFERHVVVGLGVYHDGHFAGEAFLQHALTGVLTVLGDDGVDFLTGE